MVNLETIQADIASLPLDAQQTIIELVDTLKKRYSPKQQERKEQATQDWSDFIGCVEAEPDLSQNYKTYLTSELNQKYDHC
jgi:transketolase